MGSGTGNTLQVGTTVGSGESTGVTDTLSLTAGFGDSQAVTLNVRNRSLQDTLQRLENQLRRIDECESLGMWNTAAYFLGDSAAEAETAANLYRSLISGARSGLEYSAVNTWTEEEQVSRVSRYIRNFMHPVFLYPREEFDQTVQVRVTPAALSSTEELAIQMGLPRRSVKGLPVVQHAPFGREVIRQNAPQDTEKGTDRQARRVPLGQLNYLGRKTETTVSLDVESLSMHALVTGSTGSGKSNAIYGILQHLQTMDIPFLVIEPAKGEYKDVFGKTARVFGTNPQYTGLLHLNPFRFPAGIHVLEHVDRLVEIFNVCWPMYAAMPAVLKAAVLQAYERCGWDLESSINRECPGVFPTFSDLLDEIETVVQSSAYSTETKGDYIGALATRVRSLCNGLNGQIFSGAEAGDKELFDGKVIIDLSRVGSQETKSLIMGLLVMRLNEYRMSASEGRNLPLRHLTVLEEAHTLLKRTSTEQSQESANLMGKSVELLSNSIAEMRTYGEGFLIADQSPAALDLSAIRNTNTKLILRLPDAADRELAGRAAALRPEQLEEIAKLPRGVAVVYQNDWIEAILCNVEKAEDQGQAYHFSRLDPAQLDPEAKLRTQLTQFLLSRWSGSADQLDLSEVRRALINGRMGGKQKLRLLALLQEYQQTGHLWLWEQERRGELAALLADVLECRGRAWNVLETVSDSGDQERALRRLIDLKTTYVAPEAKKLICECLRLDYSLSERRREGSTRKE